MKPQPLQDKSSIGLRSAAYFELTSYKSKSSVRVIFWVNAQLPWIVPLW